MKTVKVRIACAVDSDGCWAAHGWLGAPDKTAVECSVEVLREGERVYWLTAELPIPEPIEVQAEVEERK